MPINRKLDVVLNPSRKAIHLWRFFWLISIKLITTKSFFKKFNIQLVLEQRQDSQFWKQFLVTFAGWLFSEKQKGLSYLRLFPLLKFMTKMHRTWILVANIFVSKQIHTYTKIGRKIVSRCQIFKFLAIKGSKTNVLVKNLRF